MKILECRVGHYIHSASWCSSHPYREQSAWNVACSFGRQVYVGKKTIQTQLFLSTITTRLTPSSPDITLISNVSLLCRAQNQGNSLPLHQIHVTKNSDTDFWSTGQRSSFKNWLQRMTQRRHHSSTKSRLVLLTNRVSRQHWKNSVKKFDNLIQQRHRTKLA